MSSTEFGWSLAVIVTLTLATCGVIALSAGRKREAQVAFGGAAFMIAIPITALLVGA